MSDLQDDLETDEQTEELGDDVETLKAALVAKEQDIQKLKGQFGSKHSEDIQARRALEQKLAELEGRVGEQRELFNSRSAKEDDPFELTEEKIEEFNNNPSAIIEYNKNYLENRLKMLVDAVTARDQYYESSIQNTRGLVEGVRKEFDPERLAWKDSLDELKKNEKLAKLDDDILIEIAKTQGKAPMMEYKGGAGGGTQREAAHKPIAFDPENRQDCELFLKVANGDMTKAKKMWDNSQKKKAGL